MGKRTRVSDVAFVSALQAVKAALKANPKLDGFKLLSDETSLTPDSAKQRVYLLMRAPEMVEEIGKDGKSRMVNKGGKGIPREKFAFLFNGAPGKGNRKDLNELADIYAALGSDEDDAGDDADSEGEDNG